MMAVKSEDEKCRIEWVPADFGRKQELSGQTVNRQGYNVIE
jgi:hypothetical protein